MSPRALPSRTTPDIELASPEEDGQRTLSERLAEGPLPAAEALWYAVAVAEALKEIHDQGGVYGTLKPAEIAVTDEGIELTPSRQRGGTSAYSAPEQIRGKLDDPRSDFFALGAVMYEMLAGHRPFESEMQVLEEEPPALEGVARDLARLVRRSLEKRPERRLQRIHMLLAELKLLAAESRRQQPQWKGPVPIEASFWAHKPRRAPAVAIPDSHAVCPKCHATDVRPSRPRGFIEEFLSRRGVKISRCYRCYHRFMNLASFSMQKSEK